MSVEDATEEFHRICNEVYVDGLSAEGRTGRLRKTIEELLTRRGFPVDLKLGPDVRIAEDGCPWYVLVVSEKKINADLMLVSLSQRLRLIWRPRSNYAVIGFEPNKPRISP
jgi:hypothetical protein